MAQSDPIEILLTHDHWATRRILNACATLTPEQFHRKFEIGPGSLHNTIEHMLAAIKTWTESLAGKEPGPRLERKEPWPLSELSALTDEIYTAFMAEARRLPLSETITRVRGGKASTYTRATVITHVATHGAHHRAQALNMLRQLGVKPLPPSSIAEWSRLDEPLT